MPFLPLKTLIHKALRGIRLPSNCRTRAEANDETQTIQGVGGIEFVYTKDIDQISINDEIEVQNFRVAFERDLNS